MTKKKSERAKYVHLEDGQWHEPVMNRHREECCDCGLVHKVDYRIKETTRGTRLEFRARVDRKATAAIRRAFKFTKD